jgi:hypothetical protein
LTLEILFADITFIPRLNEGNHVSITRGFALLFGIAGEAREVSEACRVATAGAVAY